jgi:hypothetical protein
VIADNGALHMRVERWQFCQSGVRVHNKKE